jgi:indole-3-glycerol phosphate synthase
MATVLDRIVETKKREIAAAKSARPEHELRAALADAPPLRDFFAPLAAEGPIQLIAEVKKASPSKGVTAPTSTRCRSPKSTKRTAPRASAC